MWEDSACQGRCQRVRVGFLQHLGLHLDLKVCRRGGETCEGIIHRRKTGTNVCVLVRFPCLVCLSHSPTWSCSSGTDNLESGGWPHTYCIISSQTQIGHLFLRPPRLSTSVILPSKSSHPISPHSFPPAHNFPALLSEDEEYPSFPHKIQSLSNRIISTPP